jgi:RNA polymerase sigma-70 factor (ECF subfamily)
VDASDIVQDAELEVVRRMPDYLRDRRIPLRLWLRQIAYEQLLMARRKHVEAQRRAVHRELPLPARSSLQLARQLIAGGPTPSEDVAAQELARRVRQALARLPEVDREVLLMRSFEGLANQDVAQVLQIEPVAASKRYGRALLRLREALLEAGLRESDR